MQRAFPKSDRDYKYCINGEKMMDIELFALFQSPPEPSEKMSSNQIVDNVDIDPIDNYQSEGMYNEFPKKNDSPPKRKSGP